MESLKNNKTLDNNPSQPPLKLRGGADPSGLTPSVSQQFPPLRIRGGGSGKALPGELPQSQYLQPLVAAGLEPDQAEVYEILLKSGPLKAGKIALKSPLKRGLVYKILDELVGLGLVIKNEPAGKVAIFEPAHPLKVKELAEAKEAKLKTAQLALDGILGNLTSDYNLALGKPGIQFFEGKEGIKKVLWDSLTSRAEIYTYADIESINKFIPEINNEYVTKRDRLKIKKRGIVLDTPFNREFLAGYHKNVTETKFIKLTTPPFHTVMQIYDNKISYLTLDDKKMVGVIISDPNIYLMHKYLFDFLWSMDPSH